MIEVASGSDKPLVTCWMGEARVREVRALFKNAGIPTFRTPEPAVELFSHISAYYRNQRLLMQTPAPLSHLASPNVESARLVIETALAERRSVLTEMESKALLAAFRIPIASTVVARSVTEAMVLAEEIGLPLAMKIDSPQITHKSDSGGVRLNLTTLQSVRSAYQDVLDEVHRNRPDASVNGVAIEPMILKPNGREFAVVVADEWAHRGIARRLMGLLIETARAKGLKYMNGEFLSSNARMLKFVADLGFVLSKSSDDPTVASGVLALQEG